MAKKAIAVIGGGPGGYVAAIRAAQLGADVTLVEKANLPQCGLHSHQGPAAQRPCFP